MYHDNVICKGCGQPFSYESRSKKPKAVCSPKCAESVRVYTPEQRKLRVQRMKKWREDNPELNKAKRDAFYEANAERLRAHTRAWYAANPDKARETRRKYWEKNGEEINRRHREYYAMNAEEINAATRKARAENPERYRELDRKWWRLNGETFRAQRRERYANDPEFRRKHRESAAAWRSRYPEKAREKSLRDRHIRMARLRDVEYENVSFDQVCERDEWRCHICERKVAKHRHWPDPWSPSLDHVVPLSRGGGHTWDNIKLSHLHCNLAKGDRDVEMPDAA